MRLGRKMRKSYRRSTRRSSRRSSKRLSRRSSNRSKKRSRVNRSLRGGGWGGRSNVGTSFKMYGGWGRKINDMGPTPNKIKLYGGGWGKTVHL